MNINKTVKRAIADAPEGSFMRVTDFEALGPRTAIETALGRACRRGELERLEKGLYWKGARSRFGATTPNWLTLALEVSRRRAGGPTGATAAYMLSASTQIPPKAEIAVVGPRPSGRASTGIKYVMRSNPHRVGLKPEEIALLELARERFRRVELDIGDFVKRLSALVVDHRIDPERIESVAREEPRSVREALRSLPTPLFARAA